MDVEVRGQLVRRHDNIVLTGYRMIHIKPGVEPRLRWDLTPYVPLDFARFSEDAARPLLGETVHGFGTWNGEAVILGDLTADDSWALGLSEHHRNYAKDLSPVDAYTRTVEAPLFSSGTMLRRVRIRDEHGLRVIVSATDVQAVTRALRPIYGNALEVHESRWTASEVRGLDDVLNDLPEERVLKVEYRMDGEGVISRKLRVDYVDETIETPLVRFPDEMLVVEAVVEPVGAPQSRDVWFPSRARVE